MFSCLLVLIGQKKKNIFFVVFLNVQKTVIKKSTLPQKKKKKKALSFALFIFDDFNVIFVDLQQSAKNGAPITNHEGVFS